MWQIFTSKESRIILLVELISLGYVDDDFCASENDLIKEISTSFSVPDTKLRLIETWVRDEKELSSLIKKLSSKEESGEEEQNELESLKLKYAEFIQKGYDF